MRFLRFILAALLAASLTACGSAASESDSGSDGGRLDGGGDAGRMDARADASPRDGSPIDVPAITDAGADASPVVTQCARAAAVYCAQLAVCAPAEFASRFETDANCRGEKQKDCEQQAMLPGIGAVIDPMGCETALIASCDAFFAADTDPPPACSRTPGSVGSGQPCGRTDQCEGGMECYGASAGCTNGVCAPPASEGDLCTSDVECDARAGLHCVATLDLDAGTAGEPRCQTITYVDEDATCRDHSTIQCAAGLVCTRAGRCTPYLAEGDPCDPSQDLCDDRRGLTCRTADNTTYACAAPPVARLGDACDPEGGASAPCSRYAYCDASMATPVCVARAELGEPCSSSLENCAPGLTCRSGVCHVADPPTCP